MGILTEPMKKYLLAENLEGYSPEVCATYNSRILKYAREGIEDLTLLAKQLNDKQQDKVFNVETLGPFLRALFTLQLHPAQDDEDLFLRRRRILELAYDLIKTLGDERNAMALAADTMRILSRAGLNESLPGILGVKAILLSKLGNHETRIN